MIEKLSALKYNIKYRRDALIDLIKLRLNKVNDLKKEFQISNKIKSATLQKVPMSVNNRNANKLMLRNKQNIEEFKLGIIDLFKTVNQADKLFEIIQVPNRFMNDIIKFIKKFDYIIIKSSDNNELLVSWVNMKYWNKAYKITEELAEFELERLIEEFDTESISKGTNWINPKFRDIDKYFKDFK